MKTRICGMIEVRDGEKRVVESLDTENAIELMSQAWESADRYKRKGYKSIHLIGIRARCETCSGIGWVNRVVRRSFVVDSWREQPKTKVCPTCKTDHSKRIQLFPDVNLSDNNR